MTLYCTISWHLEKKTNDKRTVCKTCASYGIQFSLLGRCSILHIIYNSVQSIGKMLNPSYHIEFSSVYWEDAQSLEHKRFWSFLYSFFLSFFVFHFCSVHLNTRITFIMCIVLLTILSACLSVCPSICLSQQPSLL